MQGLMCETLISYLYHILYIVKVLNTRIAHFIHIGIKPFNKVLSN